MPRPKAFAILVLFCALPRSLRGSPSAADSAAALQAPRVYIDCWMCDMNYIRREIIFVNYVIDRKVADIHVLVTERHTGSGGHEYTLTFLGQSAFKFHNDTLTVATNPDDTEDIVRHKLANTMKLGLVSYVAKTPVGNRLSVSYAGGDAMVKQDPWRNWVFRARVNGHFDGEQAYRSQSVWGSLSANRITDAWKIRASLSTELEKSRYEYSDSTGNSVTWSSRKSRSAYGLIVRSLSDHWSIGISADAYASTYSNIRASYGVQPAIEYDLFPYSKSTRKEFRILYQVGRRARRYYEITLYDKMEEALYDQSLDFAFELKQPWGTVEIDVSGSHYLHDADKYRMDVHGEISLRLFKGLSFNTYGGYSRIHDQLSLPRGEATKEDILLRRRQLATQYDYWFSAGFAFAFGSIYNNIVNPRFGD